LPDQNRVSERVFPAEEHDADVFVGLAVGFDVAEERTAEVGEP